jgi:hypothetical protein
MKAEEQAEDPAWMRRERDYYRATYLKGKTAMAYLALLVEHHEYPSKFSSNEVRETFAAAREWLDINKER